MQKGLLVVPVILPVFFWAVYHYHKDRHLPEPIPHLLLAFALGLLAAAVSQGLYMALEPVGLRFDALHLADTTTLGLLAYSLLAIGPIEEFSKLIFFLIVIIRFDEFDEPLDGIIYASFIALGYAAVENWQYLDYLTPLQAAARGFASPVVHIVFASIWGHWIAQAHLAGRPVLPAALQGFAIAALLHGIYDFMVLQQPYSALPCAALLIIAMWIWRLRLMRRLHHEATENSRQVS
jgi:RsiW-degrading membrane proteinase PrsW (M82 family)